MKKGIQLLAISAITLLSSCSSESSKLSKYTIQGFAEGTTYSVVYIDKDESVVKNEIDSILNAFDYSCSIFNPDSRISQINNNQTDTLDRHIARCIKVADSLSRISNGLYDITIKPLTSALGFGAEQKDRVNVDSLLEFIGYKKISVEGEILKKENPNIQLDLNSIAKGYSVDLVSKFMKSRGIDNYIVEIGGEIFASGSSIERDWRVGVDKPYDGNLTPGANLQAIIPIKNRGLATSGNYRRFYTDDDGKRVNHTLNPITAESQINNMMSATVLAENCTYADGLATMMMVMGVDSSIEFLKCHPQVDAYIIYRDADSLKSYITEGIKQLLIEMDDE